MSGGELSPNTKLLNNPYGYNGEYHDLESGFQYLRARYYNPETARFITRDSYLGEINQPLTLNRYAYTANNPVMKIDPSGHMNLEAGGGGSSSSTYSTSTTSTKTASSRPVVGWGSRGDAVVIVQNILDEQGYYLGPSGVDGVYGKHTNKAIKSYQTAKGLKSDGIVGPETWGSFDSYINSKAAESKYRSKNSNACDDLGGGVVSGNGALGTGKPSTLEVELGKIFADMNNNIANILGEDKIARMQIDLFTHQQIASGLNMQCELAEFTADLTAALRGAASAERVDEILNESFTFSGPVNQKLSSKTLYRGERSSMSPDVVFENGFQPKGTGTDLQQHVSSNTTAGNFISSTSSLKIANGFAGKNGYVYEIDTSYYIDVNKALGSNSPYPEQEEFAIPGGVSPEQIKGAWVMKNGVRTGEYIPNPVYKGNK